MLIVLKTHDTPNKYFIGIDGGGTRLKGCLLNNAGEILAYREERPANYNRLRKEIIPPIRQLIDSLRHDAELPQKKVDLIGICSTGVGREEDRKRLKDALDDYDPATGITIASDAMAALTGAFGGGAGIIVIAGTGAIALARTDSGKIIRAGGWGYLIGDEGSGFALARNAINAALQDLDGRGKKTALRNIFEEHFQIANIDLILNEIYTPEFDRGRMAKLVPLVFEAAEKSDEVALTLVNETGFELGRLVAALLKKFDGDRVVSLALIGGLFHQKDLLMDSFWQAIENASHRLQVVESRYQPVVGAALLAMLELGYPIEDNFLTALDESSQKWF